MFFICNTGNTPSTVTSKVLTEIVSTLDTVDLVLD